MKNCFHYNTNTRKIEKGKELLTVGFLINNSSCLNLEACIKNYCKMEEISNKIVTIEAPNEKLYNKKVRELALKLAKAIDNNDVLTITRLKQENSSKSEFLIVKTLLDEQCKRVWDVIENRKNKLKIPKDAMKILGITNEPTLDYLLADSLKFFEKNNKDITSKIIDSILKNENLSYSVEDIHKYLRNKIQNCGIELCQNTLNYFIQKHNYTSKQLLDLCSDKKKIRKIYGIKLLINNVKEIFTIK